MPLPESVWRLYRSLDLDPHFVAIQLLRYQSRHGLTDAELAAFLGCAVDTIPRLGLCRRPESETDRVRLEVKWGLRPGSLGETG